MFDKNVLIIHIKQSIINLYYKLKIILIKL